MRLIAVFLLLSVYTQPLFAQQEKRWSVQLDLASNGFRDWDLLSGGVLYERTRTNVAAGIEVNHLLFSDGRIEWLLGGKYNFMHYYTRFVDTVANGWPLVTQNWVVAPLGVLHGFSAQTGINYLTVKDEEDDWQSGAQLMLSHTRYHFEGDPEIVAIQGVWGVRLALLGRFDLFEVSPYIYFQTAPSVTRNFSWRIPYYDSGNPPMEGSAVSRHGSYQLGLRFGIWF